MKNKILQLILPVLDSYILEWQNFASKFFYDELAKVDRTGSSSLDEGEADELPRVIFSKLDETWSVEPQVVGQIIDLLKGNNISSDAALSILSQEAIFLREMVDGLLHNKVLEESYQRTQTITWLERLFDSNHVDVSAFYKELSITLSRAVFEAVEWHIAKIYEKVVADVAS